MLERRNPVADGRPDPTARDRSTIDAAGGDRDAGCHERGAVRYRFRLGRAVRDAGCLQRGAVRVRIGGAVAFGCRGT